MNNCSFEGLFKIGHRSKSSVEGRARLTSGHMTLCVALGLSENADGL